MDDAGIDPEMGGLKVKMDLVPVPVQQVQRKQEADGLAGTGFGCAAVLSPKNIFLQSLFKKKEMV